MLFGCEVTGLAKASIERTVLPKLPALHLLRHRFRKELDEGVQLDIVCQLVARVGRILLPTRQPLSNPGSKFFEGLALGGVFEGNALGLHNLRATVVVLSIHKSPNLQPVPLTSLHHDTDQKRAGHNLYEPVIYDMAAIRDVG